MAIDVDQIGGKSKTVSELFTQRKYGLKYYQREYAWTELNVKELLDDLTGRFLEQYDDEHERKDVARYTPYFLGPIVTASEGDTLYLVDGQQRLTTLTLLLIYLLHSTGDPESQLRPLIHATMYGETSFNLQVPEREAVMQAILTQSEFDPATTPDESVRTLWERYDNIAARFPDELEQAQLPFFVDWLLNRVLVVEISATDEDMALEIFETMNDRGSRLTPTDMLKSYLLARMHEDHVPEANTLWRRRVTELTDIEKTADSDFLKAWFRSKYAQGIRERKAGATPQDWDTIGTGIHKWVRDHEGLVGLATKADYSSLVNHDFDRLSQRYKTLLTTSGSFTPGFEHVYYLASTGFTLQYSVIMAPVTPDDDEQAFQAKARMVAGFLDTLIARRMVSYRNYSYSQMVYTMFTLIKEIRDRSVDELAPILMDRLASDDGSFEPVLTFRLNMRNGRQIRYLLSRMSAWIDQECGTGQPFTEYMRRNGKNPYEVEHIWADVKGRYPQFTSDADFQDTRNRFGGLLLLPKDFNASYGAMPYEEKVHKYVSQNLLARSLTPEAYEHHPSFEKFCRRFSLEFKKYPAEFLPEHIEERQSLYRDLCELVWAPWQYGLEKPLQTERPTEPPATQ